MNAYAEKYTLKIKQVDAYNLLTNMDAATYIAAFEDDPDNDGNLYARLILTIGLYDPGYVNRLLTLLASRIR